jgi:hypothetical protein
MHGDIFSRKRSWAIGLRLIAAGLSGVAVTIVLASCGGSSKGLIPIANAGPLQSDFEAVAQAAQTGGGNCTATTEAINKTEQDFAALPATIDSGLHRRLREGISNLRERALALCAQPPTQTATTTTPRTTTTTTTTKTQTTPTTPTTTTSTPTTPTPTPVTPPNNGGGTVAPGEGERSSEGNGNGRGNGRGNEQGESGGVGPDAGGQEGGK